MVEAESLIDGHQVMLENYKEDVRANLKSLELYQNANLTKMNKQIMTFDKIVKDKLKLAESPFFDPVTLKSDLSKLKTAEYNL